MESVENDRIGEGELQGVHDIFVVVVGCHWKAVADIGLIVRVLEDVAVRCAFGVNEVAREEEGVVYVDVRSADVVEIHVLGADVVWAVRIRIVGYCGHVQFG